MADKPDQIREQVDIRPYSQSESPEEFDCGKRWFNDFINTEQVDQYLRNRLGRVKLLYFDGDLAGFFCLSPSSLRDEDYDQEEATGGDELYRGPFDMPARLLGHLALDERFQGRGLGEFLLQHIIADTLESDVPFRLVVLHAQDDVVEFYKKYDFVEAIPSADDDSPTTLMFFDLGERSPD